MEKPFYIWAMIKNFTSETTQEDKIMDTFKRHQLRIARDTLNMSDAGALIMGGMTKYEARAFLKINGNAIEKRALSDYDAEGYRELSHRQF